MVSNQKNYQFVNQDTWFYQPLQIHDPQVDTEGCAYCTEDFQVFRSVFFKSLECDSLSNFQLFSQYLQGISEFSFLWRSHVVVHHHNDFRERNIAFYDFQQPCHAPAKHHAYQPKFCLFRGRLNLI